MDKPLLMLAGPTEIEPDILLAGARPQIYFRSEEFSQLMHQIFADLKYVFQTENQVFVISSSGTAAMEAAVVNTLSRGYEVIVVNGGVFGERWAKICRGYGIKVNELQVDLGQSIDPRRIQRAIDDNTKAVFVTVDETATGALTDIQPIGKIVKDTKAILVVDAISSLGAVELRTDEWHCDVVVASSQKALGLPPGLSFITFSEEAWRFVESSDLPKFFLDIKEYKRFVDVGQTPFTPSISLLFQLSERLKKIRQTGLENILNRNHFLTQVLRTGIRTMGLELIGPKLANCVTGVKTPEGIDASKIADVMREKYNIFIVPSWGAFKEDMFRIGNFGYLNELDIIKVLSALEMVLLELGHPIQLGVGVTSAMKMIYETQIAGS